MFKIIRRILIILSILTIAIIITLTMVTNNRTFFNDENVFGNTPGNIYNGGLFSEIDGQIYFSNHNDDGSLYVMDSDCTNLQKVHNDKAVFINVDDNYIYYIRANNTKEKTNILMFNNTGLYRINRNGKNMKVISRNPGSYLSLWGNYLYYQNYDIENGLFLYRQRIDMARERLLIEEAVIPAGVYDNKLYYAGFTSDHNIKTLDLNSFTVNTVSEGNYAYPIFHGDYIYYLDLSNNYSIGRAKLDGSNPETIVDDRCSTYNITNSGKYLYYQVDDQENSKISRINLNTMEEEVILEGNYKQINVTDKFVFFKDFYDSHTFVTPADGVLKLGTFDPPKLEDE